MSALPPKADALSGGIDVRLVPEADLRPTSAHDERRTLALATRASCRGYSYLVGGSRVVELQDRRARQAEAALVSQRPNRKKKSIIRRCSSGE